MASINGADIRAAKQDACREVDQKEFEKSKEHLQLLIQQALERSIDLKPFVKQTNLVPRDMAAKMPPDDSLFRPVTDDERYQADLTAAFTAELYAAKGPRNSPGQMGLFDGKELRSGKRQGSFNLDESNRRGSEGTGAQIHSRGKWTTNVTRCGSEGTGAQIHSIGTFTCRLSAVVRKEPALRYTAVV